MVAATKNRIEEPRVAAGSPAPLPRIMYVAYPSSLTLRSANAVQTYATVAALQAGAPDCAVVIPRFAFRPSAFGALGATHLLRLPFNAGRHLLRSVCWSYLERTWFALRVLLHIAGERLRRRQPDVVYVRDIVCAVWLALVLPRFRTAVVFEMHDREATNPSANSGPVARWLARRFDAIAVRHASGVVSLTNAFLPEVRALMERDGRTPLVVIPDAYDDNVFRPQGRAEARAALDPAIPPDRPVIAYTGLTFAYHGVDTLVDACAIVRATFPSVLLLLVGGRDAERATMAERAARCGLSGNIRIVPPVPSREIPLYLAAADLLVIPGTVTNTSASPLKLFEYAAMERPIVATDLAALREVIPADAARYVLPGDPAAMAAGIIRVLTHPDEAAEIAVRARQAVAAHTYTHRASAILAFCRQMCEYARE